MSKGRLRLLWAAAGVAWLIWLGWEDRSTTPVLILAVLIAAAIGSTWLERWRRPTAAHPGWRWAAAGALMGGAVPLLATVLILVKVSLHGHNPSDFSQADIGQVLRRIPVWALAGLLAGVGRALMDKRDRVPDIDEPEAIEYNEGVQAMEQVGTDD